MEAYVRYGRALFLAAQEAGEIESVKEDVDTISASLEPFSDYSKLLDTPALSREEKHALVDAAFGTLGELSVNLLKILSDKCIFFAFSHIYGEYCRLYDLHHGIERVQAVTAYPMSDEQIKRLSVKLGELTGKRAVVENTVDPSVLGGVILRYSGVQLDGTLRRRLADLEKSLANTVV